ncbi:hypothetical protein HW132_15930 [Brasilonema sp. CT11]|nr:hypothetical protein [Brasilonema sp. CT11]
MQLIEESGIRLVLHKLGNYRHVTAQTSVSAFSLTNHIILASSMSKQPGIPKYNSNNLQPLALIAVWLNASDNALKIIPTFTLHHNTKSHIPRHGGEQP